MKKVIVVVDYVIVHSTRSAFASPTCLFVLCTFHPSSVLQIIEACLVSVLTSVISFGLPLLRKCSPCPESDPASSIECPRPPGMYGNYVNVRPMVLFYIVFFMYFISP